MIGDRESTRAQVFSVLPGLNEACYEGAYSTNEMTQRDNSGVGFLICITLIVDLNNSNIIESRP